jgi:hypothetical protein
VNRDRCWSSSEEEDLVLLFLLADREEWMISIALGIEPATFLGEIEVIVLMGIWRYERGVGDMRRVPGDMDRILRVQHQEL